MSPSEWLMENLLFDRKREEIIFNKEFYVIGVKLDTFLGMFGEAIQTALDNGGNVRYSIVNSDPNNDLGYNDLIMS